MLHEVKFGVEVSVQTLDKASAEANRLSEEINAWHISFDVQEFWGLGINFDLLVFTKSVGSEASNECQKGAP